MNTMSVPFFSDHFTFRYHCPNNFLLFLSDKLVSAGHYIPVDQWRIQRGSLGQLPPQTTVAPPRVAPHLCKCSPFWWLSK